MERKHFVEILVSGRIFNNKYLGIDEETGEIKEFLHFDNIDEERSKVGYSNTRLEKIGLIIKKSEKENSIVLTSDEKSLPLVISGSSKINYLELFNIMKKIGKYDSIIELNKLIKEGFLTEEDFNILNKEKNSGLLELFENKNNKKTYILFSELLIDLLEDFYKGEINEK